MARSLFRDMKRSCCLVCLRPSMSLGKRRGCSKALARKVVCPLWDSEIVASQGMGAPPNSSRKAYVRDPRHASAPISSLLSTEGGYLSLTFLGCFTPFRGIISPSSPSYAFLFLFSFSFFFLFLNEDKGTVPLQSHGEEEGEDYEELGF